MTDVPSDPDAEHAARMKAMKAEQDAEVAAKRDAGRGLLMVHTGDGKGKSTAAFGLIVRALGWGQKVGVVQFIKGKWITGERQFFRRLDADGQLRFHVMGEGFTWDVQDRARDVAAAEAAWETARALMADPELSLLVLDELNIALRYDYLDVAQVAADIAARSPQVSVCVTGRDARPELLDAADLVTEMTLVRHPYQNGIKAMRGVDF